MTILQKLAEMDPETRIRFVGADSPKIRRLNELTVEQASTIDALCPAALSEQVLGAPATCEAISRSAGGCRQCTARFLRQDWPSRIPDGAFGD